MSSKTAPLAENLTRPAHSIFVAANAGAGKTSQLTRRVLSLLLHGVAPSKILCLTFTNAASAEMQHRILRELGRWVMAEDNELEKALAALLGHAPTATQMQHARALFAQVLEAPEGIPIQTIHSLCQSLLRRFSLEAGVNPHFAVLDSRSQQELLEEARLRLYHNAQQQDDALSQALRALAGESAESTLQALFRAIVQHKARFLALFDGPGALPAALLQLKRALGLKHENEPLAALLRRHFDYDAQTREQLKQIAGQLCTQEGKDSAFGEMLGRWLADEAGREALERAYSVLFLTQSGEQRKQLCKKAALSPEQHDRLRYEQARVQRFQADCNARATFARTQRLLVVAEAFLALYESLKRQQSAIDYDDMILASTRLLSRANMAQWVLFKLDGGIDHILVDEAQDTSPLQWQIIQSLSEEFFSGKGRAAAERSLFIVGDEKQSIYSFQGADVAALARMQHYFAQRIEAAGMPLSHVALLHSYRSTPNILRAVDQVFTTTPAGQGLMATQTRIEHIATRTHDAGLVQLHPLLKVESEAGLSATTLLARHVAETIRGWLQSGQRLSAKNRPLAPGDILILVRSRTTLVDALVRALKRRQVPVAGIDRMLLGENLAVQDMLALAQVALLPQDDLTLAAVLKSPIFGISEEQLFALAHGRGSQSLWQRLSHSADCWAAYALLSELRGKADYLSPYAFFADALDRCGARKRIIGRMGVEFADALDEFLQQALIYEQQHAPSLQGFLHWFTHSESEVKRDMEQGGGMVRIMTIHGAKGLQAPVVILPDTATPPTLKDALLWHEAEGLALPLRPAGQDDPISAAERAQAKARMMEEYHRLLYVALTRAEDQLHIFGASSKTLPEHAWYSRIREGLAPIAEAFTTELGEGLRLGDAPQAGTRQSHAPQVAPVAMETTDFAFLHAPVPQEAQPPRPLSPSRPSITEPAAFSPMHDQQALARGRLMHKLFQHLPAVAAEKRAAVARTLARSHAPLLSDSAVEQALGECVAILEAPHFAFLFSAQSLAEAPIVGNVTVKGEVVSVAGQIDRLALYDNEVWVVDFKTNPTPPNPAPAAYVRQLALYRALVAAIYPTRTVRCALLWTATARMEVLDEATLKAYI